MLPDTAEKLFGFLGSKLQSRNQSHNDQVKREDADFKKAFVIYGHDQVEERYILSPARMRRILDFKNRSGRATGVARCNLSRHLDWV